MRFQTCSTPAFAAFALCGSLGIAAFAGGCGGASEGSAGAASATRSSAAAPPDAADASAEPAGPATTVATADHGTAEGTKLSESDASAAPAPPPHTHDPGRRPQDIAAIVVARRPEARACYDKALETHPGIEGDLVVQWTIDSKGTVTQIDVDMSRSTLVEASVVSCVEDVVKRIKFAPSPGGYETKANYPFNFRPHGDHHSKGP
jgi:hypothetical protein